MNVESTFESEKNLTLIARKAVLQEWSDHRPIRKLACPHCDSDRVNRRMRSRNGSEYICKDCRQDISEEDMPQCCPYPGRYMKCQNCFYFQAFVKAVKEKVPALRHLTPEERAAIVAAPGFYQVERPNQSSQQPIPTERLFPLLATDGSDRVQLSIFDNIDESLLDSQELEQSE